MDSVDLEVVRSALKWTESGHRATLGTVVHTWGSAPRPVGAMLVIRDDGQVMGDNHQGKFVLILKPIQDLVDMFLSGQVDVGGRLVKQKHIGASDQCQRDQAALELSAGKLTDARL